MRKRLFTTCKRVFVIGAHVKLNDVAKLANVSVATASKALRGKGRVSRATRERVLAIAREVEYEPWASGRALVTGRRQMIGFVGEGAYWERGEWIVPLLGGLSKALGEHDYHTVFFTTEPREDRVPAMVLQRAVDGIVLATSWTPRFLSQLVQRGIPHVVVDPRVEVDCDSVRGDDVEGARAATKHLLELGHRRIAYVGWGAPPGLEHVNRERWSGFVEVMSDAGLAVNPGGDRSVSREELLTRALEATSPTAMVCFNDNVAMWAICELRARGLEVPRDVSVVGFDDMSYLDWITPKLTTMRLPYEQMGAEAARLVLGRLDAPDLPPRAVVLPEKLIVRESTGAPGRE